MGRACIPDNGVDNGGWQSVWEWRAQSRLSVKDGDELVDVGRIAHCGWVRGCRTSLSAINCSFDSNAFQRVPLCTSKLLLESVAWPLWGVKPSALPQGQWPICAGPHLTRVLSTAHILIGTARPHSPPCCCIHINMSSKPKDKANRRPPVQRSNIGDPGIPSTAKGLTPKQVRELPALIAYVVFFPCSF